MVTFNSVYDSAAVVDAAVKLFCTCKDVNHGTIIGANIGVGTVEGCIKEHVFYSKVVRKIEGQEVGAANIPTGRSMWAKNSH
jgi:hypothetical protein